MSQEGVLATYDALVEKCVWLGATAESLWEQNAALSKDASNSSEENAVLRDKVERMSLELSCVSAQLVAEAKVGQHATASTCDEAKRKAECESLRTRVKLLEAANERLERSLELHKVIFPFRTFACLASPLRPSKLLFSLPPPTSHPAIPPTSLHPAAKGRGR